MLQQYKKLSMSGLLLSLLVIAVTLTGCGGGGGGQSSNDPDPGSASFTIEWSDGNKADSTPQSARIEIRNSTTVLQSRTIEKPTEGNSTVTFTDLPSGMLIVSANIFSGASGSGDLLKSAITPISMSESSVNMVFTDLESIDKIDVVVEDGTVQVNNSVRSYAIPRSTTDKVVFTRPGQILWSVSGGSAASVDASGSIRGVAPGDIKIVATDDDTDKSGEITVTVTDVPDAIAVAGETPDIESANEKGGVLIAWDDFASIDEADIVEYHIWLDNNGPSTAAHIAPAVVLLPANTEAYSGILGEFDNSYMKDTTPIRLSYKYPSQDHKSLLSISVSGMISHLPGTQHSYSISCVYKRNDNGNITYWETSAAPAGKANYLTRPVPVTPTATATQKVDINDITFTWKGCKGATEYIIEVSSDPTFRRDKTWVCEPMLRTVNADGVSMNKVFPFQLANSSEIGDLNDGTTVYWRVGARDKSDAPGPYPAGPSASSSGNKSTRYIYNSADKVLSFRIKNGPPPPP